MSFNEVVTVKIFMTYVLVVTMLLFFVGMMSVHPELITGIAAVTIILTAISLLSMHSTRERIDGSD